MSEALMASIGTTHPWNSAGVGLDAHVAADYGLAHCSVIAAVSAQNERGLQALETVSPALLRAQLASLPATVAAYRIGALVSSENVAIVVRFLRERVAAPVVLDPVVNVTLGGELCTDADLMRSLREDLLPLGSVIVTPNLDEARDLLGMPVNDERSMRAAARRLLELGALGAVVTGGHLEGDPMDVLADGTREETFRGPRLPGSMRGGGCTFAAALACELALRRDLHSAAARAHAYVRERIAAATMRGGLQVAF